MNNKSIYLYLTFATCSIACVLVFFVVMHLHGYTQFSNNIADWGAFGSYVGGTVAAIGSMISIFFLIGTLKQASYHKEIDLLRKSIDRLEHQLEELFNQPFKNESYQEYLNLPSLEVLKKVSTSANPPDDLRKFAKSLAGLSGALLQAVEAYRDKVKNLAPTNVNGDNWLTVTEKYYWIMKHQQNIKILFQLLPDKYLEQFPEKELSNLRFAQNALKTND